MPVKQPNFDRVQHASVRVKVDPKYVALQRELDEAWYGDKDENGRSDRSTGAKAGVQGRVWHGRVITSEEQFNRLSALIEAHRMTELVDQNIEDGTPYPDMLERVSLDENDVEDERVNVRSEAQARINSERQGGLEIDAIAAEVRARRA